MNDFNEHTCTEFVKRNEIDDSRQYNSTTEKISKWLQLEKYN